MTDYRPHIVVVEDEAAQRHLLVEYLAKHNFRVTGVDGGPALRRLVERELPNVVLLDVGLPGEDGFALARWLRERSGRLGIIMVTAASDTVDRVAGLETGADDYIGTRALGPSEERPAACDRRCPVHWAARAVGAADSRPREARPCRSARRQRGNTRRERI